jgi:hypothetical protein
MYIYKVSLDSTQPGLVYSKQIEEAAHSQVLSISNRNLSITQANIRKNKPGQSRTPPLCSGSLPQNHNPAPTRTVVFNNKTYCLS